MCSPVDFKLPDKQRVEQFGVLSACMCRLPLCRSHVIFLSITAHDNRYYRFTKTNLLKQSKLIQFFLRPHTETCNGHTQYLAGVHERNHSAVTVRIDVGGPVEHTGACTARLSGLLLRGEHVQLTTQESEPFRIQGQIVRPSIFFVF